MERHARVAGIILAAGASSRMGRSKALLPIGTDTFVTRVARTVADAGASPVVVVAAAGHAELQAAIDAAHLPVSVVINPDRDRGQLSSILAGLEAVDEPDLGAVLVCLVDCPLVSRDTIERVIDAYRTTGAPIVRPHMGGRHGHPALFSRHVFDELRRTDQAVGAKAVVRAHAAESVDVDVADIGAFRDIDTPADYVRVIEEEATRPIRDGLPEPADEKKARTTSEL